MKSVSLSPADNVMYSTSTTSSATILTSTCNTAAVLVYEPLKDDEFNNSKAQATYETPQASGMQNINNKQVRIHAFAHDVGPT